jgi:hypothetical protein
MHGFQKWRDAIHIAPDEKTVAALMHDYVAGFDADTIRVFPQDCQRALLGMDGDIQGTAVTLLRAELADRGSREADDLLHEVAHTLASASVRISQLRGQLEPTRANSQPTPGAK